MEALYSGHRVLKMIREDDVMSLKGLNGFTVSERHPKGKYMIGIRGWRGREETLPRGREEMLARRRDCLEGGKKFGHN
ncbi:hypothetical protein NECAME_09631 [Necator americanus]|uniref:Uncharacterized protein n=1 Tax=Necator americanus TaxID=51031 RepID=W2TDB2_NECAM|nr:hypothetical protein NECAME_09631 [Necator americanus]ETN79798.1 hypothetical protein NECAME_09631 [Necator americanus]